mmetsp:Transcript_761/g.1549  ORF Transcript_761/g.1549 Transcript_761/m.1549 type:complete len:94 (+) Transcript_761:1347-1628(+)
MACHGTKCDAWRAQCAKYCIANTCSDKDRFTHADQLNKSVTPCTAVLSMTTCTMDDHNRLHDKAAQTPPQPPTQTHWVSLSPHLSLSQPLVNK